MGAQLSQVCQEKVMMRIPIFTAMIESTVVGIPPAALMVPVP